ncbi:MAG: MotA/TolQ/ExbB proton channel family protein [Granulosicoccus sp.]|nr:MotA/TolQ/ExbB proton channel family protein [Granulosicoccus sp.]
MDIATLFGMVAAFGVIVAAIVMGGSADTFINVPSIVVVVGGTFGATLMQISLGQFLGSFKVALRAFLHKNTPPNLLIDEALDLAETARKEGILALEEKEITDPFLNLGVGLCIDGHPIDTVQNMLSKNINLELERQKIGITMFKSVGEAAPAMGMIGTLIGLVQMLANMEDPKQIGPAMAVALLTTLYGAIIANAAALPIAAKLKAISSDEKLNKLLILESIDGIQQGTNPRVLRQILNTYLPENKRDAGSDDK